MRKVQVSTHFDEINFDELNGPSTPDPPGINAPIASEVKTEAVTTIDTGYVSGPQPRQAVYAARIPSPPLELNTLVPEDFDMIDFWKKPTGKGEEVPLKTDDSFALAKISEAEEPKNMDGADTGGKNTEESSKEHGPNTTAVLVASAVTVTAITAAAILNEKEAETLPKAVIPVVEASSISEEPLKKVSEARKSIEASSLPSKNPEIKAAAPIVIEKSLSPKVFEQEKEKSSQVHKEEVTKASSIAVSNVEEPAAPIIIAKVPQKPEIVEKDEKAQLKPESTHVAPIIIADAPNQAVPEPEPEKVLAKFDEVKAPPPLPTNTEHLVAARESLKPSMSPVKPVNGAPTSDPSRPKSSSSPLARSGINSEVLEKLTKELEKQKLALENESDTKKALESQINAMISRSNAQEEALRYKNESMEQLQTDFMRINKDLTAVKSEKDRLEASLAKAQEELKATSDSDAQAYLQKSDLVTELKDQVAEFASIIGQKNKEIDSLQHQLEEVKRANMKTALDNVQQYEKIEDELLKIVEEEILRMQDTIDEQREYNSKMQVEVDSEYAYWKRRLSKSENETK